MIHGAQERQKNSKKRNHPQPQKPQPNNAKAQPKAPVSVAKPAQPTPMAIAMPINHKTQRIKIFKSTKNFI
jgi:hypothetical protein